MKSPINKIIVNVNYSDSSLNAVNTAIHMCRRHDAELHLLYVMKITDLYASEGLLGPVATYNDTLLNRDLEVFKNLTAMIKSNYSVDCTLHYDINTLTNGISEKAALLDCDLIVVPVEEKSRRFGYMFDSIAYSVFKKSSCPVLTVPADRSFEGFNNILFPIRESKDVQDKYFFSRSIFQRNNANVSIIGLLEEHNSKKTRALREMIGQVRHWMKKDGLFYTSGVAYNPDQVLGAIEMGENEGVDLIVINASARRSLWQYLFGSYTQKLIRNQQFAVLCFKPKRKNIPLEEPIGFDQKMAFA